MTLDLLRTYIGRLTRSGADTDRYSVTDIDLAALTLGNHFVNVMSPWATSTVTITAASTAVSFSGITAFRPSKLLRARVTVDSNYTATSTKYGVDKVEYGDVLEAAACAPRNVQYSAGVPRLIGFSAEATAIVWPTPTYTGSLTVWYRDAFVVFTPGTGSPSGVTINIPDDLIYDWLQAVADFVELDTSESRRAYIAGGNWQNLLSRASATRTLGGNATFRSGLADGG